MYEMIITGRALQSEKNIWQSRATLFRSYKHFGGFIWAWRHTVNCLTWSIIHLSTNNLLIQFNVIRIFLAAGTSVLLCVCVGPCWCKPSFFLYEMLTSKLWDAYFSGCHRQEIKVFLISKCLSSFCMHLVKVWRVGTRFHLGGFKSRNLRYNFGEG